jgi:hypothetical protein
VTYARDPYDTDEPPCFCPVGSPDPRTTQEYCPAHGDPAKPAPEPPDDGTHFPGCHPEDAEGRREAAIGEIQDTENCWHCGTPAPRGCDCFECWENSDYVPQSAVYHCKTCGRWWAWMTGLNITTITFGEPEAEAGTPAGQEG